MIERRRLVVFQPPGFWQNVTLYNFKHWTLRLCWWFGYFSSQKGEGAPCSYMTHTVALNLLKEVTLQSGMARTIKKRVTSDIQCVYESIAF